MKNRNKNILLFWLLLLLIQQTILFPQSSNIVFEQYSTDKGLSGSIVQCVIQDKTGYLWFGTFSGIDRFDGVKFKSYKNKPGDSLSITNGFVQCLLEDNAGNLWIGTSNGLDRFDRSTEKFYHYRMFNGDSKSGCINAIIEDEKGLLLLGTNNGLYIFNPVNGYLKNFIHNDSSDGSLINNTVVAILKDKRGDIWIGTDGGLDKFEISSGLFYHIWYHPDHIQPRMVKGIVNKYQILSLFEDTEGILWIGTSGGLLELDQLRENFTLLESDPHNPSTLSFPDVTSVCQENEKFLWVSTWVGLNLFNKETREFTRFYHFDKSGNSISHNNVSALLKERSGTLFVCTFGGGINKVNQTIYPFIQYPVNVWRETSRFSSASILYLSASGNGTVWMGTPTGLLNFDPVTQKFRDMEIKKNIRVVKEDKSGNLWMGINISSGRGFLKMEPNGKITEITDSSGNKLPGLANEIIFDGDSLLWVCTGDPGEIIKINTRSCKYSVVFESAEIITTIVKDRNGQFWAALRENGLICFDPETQKTTNHIFSDVSTPGSISGNSVMNIYEDEIGDIWLGTNMGLNKYDRKKNQFTCYTEDNGLPHNWVYLIFEDSRHNLWLSTLKGISKFNPSTEVFKNYDVLFGLVASDRSGVGCQVPNGEIYLDSPGGLTRMHPDSIHDNLYIPPVVITDISVSGKKVLYNKELELDYNQNNISLEFASLSYVRSEQNSYSYILEGLDEEWKPAGTSRVAFYTNLDPGEYTFRVKGSNNDGIWNEAGTSISIIISPPWWLSKLAFFLYFILIASLSYLMWKSQIKRIRVRHEFEMSRFEAAKLHQLDEMKTKFFTNISHELRTPLTLILGPVKHLLKKTKDEKIIEELQLIHNNASKLNRLVNELLDISKFEAGEMKLKAYPLNIIDVVKELILPFYPLAERKNISFRLYSEEEDIIAYIEKEKFDKILSNLLLNAFKFTPEGGCINLGIIRYSESGKEFVKVSVKDTGIGISSDEIGKIFDRFYQVSGNHPKDNEGTGIGLALTKELVELHKGRIEVESREGEGAEFRIIFPLGSEHLMPEEICEEKSHEDGDGKAVFFEENLIHEIDLHNEPSKPLLLVVEDNADVRKYIRIILQQKYNILEAVNGEEGLCKSFELIPDIIISDIKMPVMDGLQFCSLLKTDLRTSHIPVVMLTARASMSDKISGLENGADDYILKPFEEDELKVRIKNLLEQRKRVHEHFRKSGLVDFSDKRFTPTDNKFLQKVIDTINEHISDASFSVEKLAGEIAVSRSFLFKKIDSLLGESPGELIRRIRLNKAAKLISVKTGNISEIALEVGFNNPSHFADCFKKQFGKTPSHYMDNLNE